VKAFSTNNCRPRIAKVLQENGFDMTLWLTGPT
jgi:hypothetical protein